MNVSLKGYTVGKYEPGASRLKRFIWYYVNLIFFRSGWIPATAPKIFLLKLFGARVGTGVNIKPHVNIKYPWHLHIGDYTWIGEGVWIDNLVKVSIGSNCCISQGALLLTGNHNFKTETFDLMTGEIIVEDSVWIGARAIVTSKVTCRSHSILLMMSVASSDMDAFGIYRGNPAQKVKIRILE